MLHLYILLLIWFWDFLRLSLFHHSVVEDKLLADEGVETGVDYVVYSVHFHHYWFDLKLASY